MFVFAQPIVRHLAERRFDATSVNSYSHGRSLIERITVQALVTNVRIVSLSIRWYIFFAFPVEMITRGIRLLVLSGAEKKRSLSVSYPFIVKFHMA